MKTWIEVKQNNNCSEVLIGRICPVPGGWEVWKKRERVPTFVGGSLEDAIEMLWSTSHNHEKEKVTSED